MAFGRRKQFVVLVASWNVHLNLIKHYSKTRKERLKTDLAICGGMRDLINSRINCLIVCRDVQQRCPNLAPQQRWNIFSGLFRNKILCKRISLKIIQGVNCCKHPRNNSNCHIRSKPCENRNEYHSNSN